MLSLFLATVSVFNTYTVAYDFLGTYLLSS